MVGGYKITIPQAITLQLTQILSQDSSWSTNLSGTDLNLGAAIRRSPAVDLFEQHQGTHILQVEMTGSSIFDYIHQADHAEFAEQLGLSLTSGGIAGSGSQTGPAGLASPHSGGSDDGVGSHGTNNPDGMVALAIALPPPSVHEIRLECDMFVTRLNFDFRIAHCEPSNRKGQVLTGYYRLMNKNGGYTWMQSCATVVCNSKNADEQNIICVNYVISNRENENLILDCCQLEPSLDSIKHEDLSSIDKNSGSPGGDAAAAGDTNHNGLAGSEMKLTSPKTEPDTQQQNGNDSHPSSNYHKRKRKTKITPVQQTTESETGIDNNVVINEPNAKVPAVERETPRCAYLH
ncbi:Protein trachealess [Eumeta japonica]|uniref:Protein trachealess n=1 Tax=Eumeta variegata TaxID=151549 RepID=A0A4C1SRW2_EUMVA|nr:Protein trachealess [Eumeta japonica]